MNGSWSFNLYIPLPQPVSFLGINFQFSVTFRIGVGIFAKGNPEIFNCIFNFALGANAETAVGVVASAAIRAIAIEGGVFIGGDLVKLSTDPQFKLSLNLLKKTITAKIEWYFYLNAFQFEWGFFWRYWRLFKGWSDRKIIKSWPITNGITQKYLIYKS